LVKFKPRRTGSILTLIEFEVFVFGLALLGGDEKGEVLLDLGLDEVQFIRYSFCFEIKAIN
jgi:hypothetical protein